MTSTGIATASAADGGPVARAATVVDLRGLINAERADRGLVPVHADARLTRAARAHSSDMVEQGYASHTSRDGSTLRQRVRRAGYLKGARRWVVGEALAWASGPRATGEQLVAALMASPSHRAILLDPDVREVGIGLAKGLPRPGGHAVASGITATLDFGVVHPR